MATVAIDGAANAAILAAQILATEDGELRERLRNQRMEASKNVLKKDSELNI